MNIECAEIEKQKIYILDNIIYISKINISNRYEAELRGIHLVNNLSKLEKINLQYYEKCSK